MTQPTSPPAGWYPAPHADNEQRYWDGVRWAEVSPAPTYVPPMTFPRLRGLSSWIGVLVGVVVLASVTSMVVEAWGLVAMQSFVEGRTTLDELEAYDSVSLITVILSAATFIPAAVCWMVWQHRAAVRALTTVGGGIRRAPVWHVVSWIIPVVSLWFPLQNMKDLARSSGAAVSTALLGGWWACWIGSSVLINAGSRLLTAADTIEVFTGALIAIIVGDLLIVVAAPLAWVIVRRITDALEPATR